MSDYIKREDAIASIMAHDLVKDGDGSREWAEYLLEDATINDVVEVVRCKDCKHHEELLCNNDGKVLCWVHGLDVVVDGNGYCNYGERKEQENEMAKENDIQNKEEAIL